MIYFLFPPLDFHQSLKGSRLRNNKRLEGHLNLDALALMVSSPKGPASFMPARLSGDKISNDGTHCVVL